MSNKELRRMQHDTTKACHQGKNWTSVYYKQSVDTIFSL